MTTRLRLPMERDAVESIEDVVTEVRAYRFAIEGWAKDYAAARLLTPSCSNVDSEAAVADLRRWSRLYFAASRRSQRDAGRADARHRGADGLQQAAREQSL